MSKKPAKRYSKMNTAELRAATAEFDRDMDRIKTSPLTAAQRALVERAKNKGGRPQIGEGAEKIRITVERGLLRRVDAVAKKQKTSRSQLIAQALTSIIAN